jgi:hypothetical protein
MGIDSALDARTSRSVAWIHGIQFLTILACAGLPHLLAWLSAGDAKLTAAGAFVAFLIDAVPLVVPLAVPGLFYLWWRRHSERIAFHALQDLYWQFLCNLVAWTLAMILLVQAIAGFGAAQPDALELIVGIGIAAAGLANVYFVGKAFVMALFVCQESDHPVVARLARAITVGLPLAR